jgi:hypothetical protein
VLDVFLTGTAYRLLQSSLPEQLRRHRLLRGEVVQRVLRARERWLLRHVDLVACSSGLGVRVRDAVPAVPLREWLYPAPLGAVAAGEVEALRGELRIAPGAPVVRWW